MIDTPIFQREQLPEGFSATGPAIVEEAESTTVIRPNWRVEKTRFRMSDL